jgi:crystallin alpha B
VANDPNKFVVKLDCSHFKPEEIEVKTIDNNIMIHGKHEEKMDKHGWVTREFTRRYALPEECQAKEVTSSLQPSGVLLIEAPKKRLEPIKDNERVVPIKVVHEISNGEQNQIQN